MFDKIFQKTRGFFKRLREEYRRDRRSFVFYFSLRMIVTVISIMQFISGNYQAAALCLFTLVLFLLPAFVQTTFNVEVPSALEILIMIFIFAAQILGNLSDYYVKIPLWDSILHTVCGFLSAAVGLSLIDLLNKSDKIKISLSPPFVALFAFCFSMTIGIFWEFFEFGADVLFLTDMQKDTVVNHISSVYINPERVNEAIIIRDISHTAVNGSPLTIEGYLDIGLYDTMKDLLVNFIGATVFSIFGYFYTKYRGGGLGARVVEKLKITRRRR